MGSLKRQIDVSAAFNAKASSDVEPNGKEPILGGKLRQKAVWVDESECIGCRYCANVASNTFGIESYLGRSRVFRQDGDRTEIVQEAIDTCPVDCIHWVKYEELDELRQKLDDMDLQPLGMLPKITRPKSSLRKRDS